MLMENFAQDKGLPLRKEIGFPMAIVLVSKAEKLPYWFPPWFSVSWIQNLFQGDHLGVEFAFASHEQLLVDEGLLDSACRLLGHPVPDGCRLEGLIIDDYFAIGVEPL